jgi:stress-induced-phosphoprotein 1
VVRAFIDDSLRNSVESALEFYNCAIDILKWGAEHWGDVSFEEKGAIFQPTIARGIKSLRLSTLMKVGFTPPAYVVCADTNHNTIRVARKIPENTLMMS